MPTRDQVLSLLREGHSAEMVASELRVPAGHAYMIATGVPADASGVPAIPDLGGKVDLPVSSQRLVNPRSVNPTRNAAVTEWVHERAARELTSGA
jgi:hypothetical protein